MEEFMEWIKDVINPMRQQKGLCAIGYDEQVRCYEIIQAFSSNWTDRQRVHSREEVEDDRSLSM